MRDKIAGNGDTNGTFRKISWMKLWLACAFSPNKLRVCLCPTFLTNGWKKDYLQWIYYPTNDWVCVFVCFKDRLANFRSQDWKIFGHAPNRNYYGLVQPVGPRLIQSWLFTVHYFSEQMALFPGSKFPCKLLSPNSRNESRPWGVFSELLVF